MLMERLFDYIPDAIAFIYVINTANAGGVENKQWVSSSFLNDFILDNYV